MALEELEGTKQKLFQAEEARTREETARRTADERATAAEEKAADVEERLATSEQNLASSSVVTNTKLEYETIPAVQKAKESLESQLTKLQARTRDEVQ